MRNFIRYYKWHLIYLLLIIICTVFVLTNMVVRVNPDLVISYAGTKYVNAQTFNDSKPQLELLLQDATDDEKKTATLVTYTADLQKDVDEYFAESIEEDMYNIFIASKETFETYKDTSVFEDLNEYYPALDKKKTAVLEDADNHIYAVSLENNTYIKDMGFIDTDDLYIAVAAASDPDKVTAFEKNGRNITQHIIDNK